MGLPFLAAIWFIPESPTYLIKIGNQDRARKVLEKLGNGQKSKVFRALLLTYFVGRPGFQSASYQIHGGKVA